MCTCINKNSGNIGDHQVTQGNTTTRVKNIKSLTKTLRKKKTKKKESTKANWAKSRDSITIPKYPTYTYTTYTIPT